MNHALTDADVRRDMPAVWEVLRAVSGLVAIVVLLVLLTGAAIREQAGRSLATEPDFRRSAASAWPHIATPKVAVFYLVTSPEQAQIADWNEYEAAGGAAPGHALPDRTWRMLYVTEDGEPGQAAQTIFAYVLNNQDGTLVEVIDLRDVQTAPFPGAVLRASP